MAGKPGRPRSLTLEQIAQAALDDGLATFSMPSVSRRVGVAHSALYRYVTSRDELLYLSLERALGTTQWPDADQPWREILRAIGEAMWDLCERYPGFDRAMSTAKRYPETYVEHTKRYVSELVKQGFTAEDAALLVDFVGRLTLSCSHERERLDQMVATIGVLEKSSPFVDPANRGWYNRQLEIILAGAETLIK